jgi:translation initiation factor 2 alpha subunit (eIF-2alpha)
MELEQGDVVLCTVDRIAGTTVFVNIEGNGEGRIVLSEIAPGRIRNLRDYVVPKKTIVCKILKVSGNDIELSLRRVKEKEKKEVMEQHKIEKSYTSVFKTILKDKAKNLIETIKKEKKLFDFVEEIKEDPKKLEKLIGKEDSKKILEILNAQKQKTVILKKEIKIQSEEPDGLKKIKEIFSEIKGIEASYLGSGKYSLKTEGRDLKKADQKIQENIEMLEKLGKNRGVKIHFLENK